MCFANTYANVFDNAFFPVPNRYPFSTQGANPTPSAPIPTHISTVSNRLSGVNVQENKGTSPTRVGDIVLTPLTVSCEEIPFSGLLHLDI